MTALASYTAGDRILVTPSERPPGWTYSTFAIYGTYLRTDRYIGRCQKPGCKHRVVLDVTIVQRDNQSGRWEDKLLPTADEACPWISIDYRFGAGRDRRSVLARELFEHLGIFCPEDGNRLKLKLVKSSHRPNVKCTSVCHNATSATCDCACNGKAHGKNWQRH